MPKANIGDDDHPQLHEDVVTFSGGPNHPRRWKNLQRMLTESWATRSNSTEPNVTLIDQVRDSAKAGVA